MKKPTAKPSQRRTDVYSKKPAKRLTGIRRKSVHTEKLAGILKAMRLESVKGVLVG
jgi:hypothetical protein